MTIRCFISVLGMLAIAYGAIADDGASGHARLDQFLAELTTFSAHFEQQLFDEYGALIETAEGVVDISKPGKFRWEYRHPYRQLIVSDGTTLWVYDVDLEQVSMNPLANGGAGSPAELLVGDIDLEQHYVVVELGVEVDISWVSLTPRVDANQYQMIELGLDKGGLRAMRLRDNLNQLTTIQFDRVQNNVAIEPARFDFVPPAGVDVVGGRAN